ncbi:MAG TPA: 16S rRNA (cytidine(1402)-2'-O)-methyltransferase [Thermodesulfobacteriota bacterium]|jgi:16S rRNA (cytidine1402-2'-O)-methyltransferase|nr:16S rRNA (cytidine(1402)-2'-O)-methyltransferase [Thermodesulfobacteriota bacterium]
MNGKLYIVSTPIGNLEDITLRAIRTLKEVDLIACEDTRVTKKLLSRYRIEKPLTSYHEHNEKEKAKELLLLLESGKNIALVSDAGTPGVSDPGYRLVRLASERGIGILAIPGPSAAIAALSVSGLPTSSFAFFGFPPRSEKARRELLNEIRNYPQTLVFYESPKRVIETLKTILDVLGDRRVSVSRELTKTFEETIRESVSKVIEILAERKGLKGEFTIVVEGNMGKIEEPSLEAIEKHLRTCKEMGLTLKDSVREVSKRYGISRSRAYREALRVWEKT